MATGTGNTALDDFRAGVTACLRSWSALRTAVESGWGGNESHDKAEDLRRYIYDKFDGTSFPPKGLDLHDLQDDLAIFMEEEYSVTLEDGSERQVADSLWRMYEACSKGDSSLAHEMVQKSIAALNQIQAYPVQVQTNEFDEDDDEMEDMSADVSQLVSAGTEAKSSAEYASQDLFPGGPKSKPKKEVEVRQLGEAAPEPEPEVEMDDDGFAPVQTKRRGKR